MQTLSNSKNPTGISAFLIIWFGQFVSILSSGMSSFALSIWLFQQTRSATMMGLGSVCYFLPFVLICPFAGVMVDRYNRKLMMMVSDMTAVTATAALLLVQLFGVMEYWHILVAEIFYGMGNAFQLPAFSAAVTNIVKKEHYGRVNGLISILETGPLMLSPILAGALLPLLGLTGLLALDMATCFVAIGILLLVNVPQPKKTKEEQKENGNIWHEAFSGIKYIFQRPSLLRLQMILLSYYFFAEVSMLLKAPLILLRTNDDIFILGVLNSVSGLSEVLGGILIGIWGGFKKRIHGVLLGCAATGFFEMLFGFGTSLALWLPFAFVASLVYPIVTSSNQSILQSKVAPYIQGRVFSVRILLSYTGLPISQILVGVLADKWLEPSMTSGTSALALIFGSWVGTGPGSGVALLYIFFSLISALVGLSGYFIRQIRYVETILPDNEQIEKAV